MKIQDVINALEKLANPSLQETYDNCGLLTGNNQWQCTGVLCTLDCLENIIDEAITKKCNLIVAHHPIIFSGLKKLSTNHYVERTIIKAIKNDIAIYAIHTNLDNIKHGVNKIIADKLGLQNQQILFPKTKQLMKLFVFVPIEYANKLKDAIFNVGGGNIGNYSECSFSAEGVGTFKASEKTNPFVGEIGERHSEKELKIEVVFPAWLQNEILEAVRKAHPYEEIAYDIVALENKYQDVGSGIIGNLPKPKDEKLFLAEIKAAFELQTIKHTQLLDKKVEKVAVCGGSGSFLINKAKAAKADFFITSDIKYHEFFEADNTLVLADIGHWESEQFTSNLLLAFLQAKFPTFAVLKSEVYTNPARYFF
ncbi:MAG: Nif3-like dinuclear metal center hexameric protein [Bacteroidetes bacterium]|nr:Nif3-like dinuclear metal center hexameric protein [Bacteroidota bacterium]MBS1672002.1 Nif3-like dinuclear metal center hexameric protein [Bacteroidota bacterium]